MQFSIVETDKEGTQVLTNLTPWEYSASSALQALLLKEQDRVTLSKTLAPLFEADLNALKREAACDTLKSNK